MHTFTRTPWDPTLLKPSPRMDQTLQRDAPPRVLVLVCNLEGGWQRHETWGFFLLLPRPCICYAFLWTTLSWWTTTLGGLREGHTHSLTHLFMSISSFLIYYRCDSSLHPVTYFLRLWKNTVKNHHQDNFQVLNWSFLSVCLPGPMASTVHGRELQDASMVRKMVQQNSARGGQTHRPTSSKRRRPRPRLSHKGPMPF